MDDRLHSGRRAANGQRGQCGDDHGAAIQHELGLVRCFSQSGVLSFQWTSAEVLRQDDQNGTPVYALVFSNALALIAMLNYKTGPGKVFTYLIDISGSATYIAWAVIGVVHLRFRQAWIAQGHQVHDLPYQALFYPYGTMFVIFINTFLVFIAGYSCFVGGFQPVDFVVSYVVIAVFAVLYIGWKVVKRTKVVPLIEIDLTTGRRVAVVSTLELKNQKRRVF